MNHTVHHHINSTFRENRSPGYAGDIPSPYRPFVTASIHSADSYHAILKKEHEKERDTVHAEAITELGRGLFEIHLSRRILHVDSVVFCASPEKVPARFLETPEERCVDASLVHLYRYDREVPSVCVEVREDFLDVFRTLLPEDITLVSDPAVSVRRVKRWYEQYGDRIRFPLAPAILGDGRVGMHLRGTESDTQEHAVYTALSEPVSYIWGAPGTGKTQVVLANSLLSYIKQQQLVYVVAPTSRAIERVLCSVIQALQEQGESIDCLFRPGMASEAFARRYPSICEHFNAEEQIDLCRRELDSLRERLVQLRRVRETQRQSELLREAVDEREALRARYEACTRRIEEVRTRLADSTRALQKASDDVPRTVRELQDVITRQSSVAFFATCRFSKVSQHRAKEEMKRALEAVTVAGRLADECKAACETYEGELQREAAILPDLENAMAACEQSIRSACAALHTEDSSTSAIQRFLNTRDTPDVTDTEEELSELISRFTDTLKAAEQSRAHGAEGKYVIGLTVDHLMAHFSELSDARVAHVFLDEADDCPFIKAGALFALGAPVTYLGDHMQLPPFCEASDTQVMSPRSGLFLWAQSSVHFPHVLHGCDMHALFRRFTERATPESEALPMVALNKTYRFGRELAEVLERFVYKNDFEGTEHPETAVVVLPVPAPAGDRRGRRNTAEANAIRKYIEKYQPENYVVLTPYTDQVKELQNTLIGVTERRDIMTVHRSSGRAWDTVILSVSDSVRNKLFTDTAKPQSDGLRLINTAVSCARREIVIVCDSAQWSILCTRQLIGGMVALPSRRVISL